MACIQNDGCPIMNDGCPMMSGRPKWYVGGHGMLVPVIPAKKRKKGWKKIEKRLEKDWKNVGKKCWKEVIKKGWKEGWKNVVNKLLF